MTAREIAFDVLMKMHRGAYSNISLDAALNEAQGMDSREYALASNLVYGVTERRLTLDYLLSACLDKPIKKLRPEVLTVLRLGAYQLLFTDKIPDSAAVNESVQLAKGCGCQYAASLVNAVLRKVAARGLVFPEDDGKAGYLSVRYSCETWIAGSLLKQYGSDTARAILEASLSVPPVTLRVNTLKTTADGLIAALKAEGVEAERSYIAADAVNITKSGVTVNKLKSFEQGLFHVQDAACQLCCAALDVKPGQTVLDLCAAPGGKSFTIAQLMENRGIVKAFDIYPHKTKLIDFGIRRLGTDCVVSCINDAAVYRDSLCGAHRVLCDVPCSGLGIIARKPEIKYKAYEQIKGLSDIQYSILSNGARYVKPGGRLVYSTCTLLEQENEKICDRFLSEHPEYEKAGEYVKLLPGVNGCDGFFYAALDRRKQ